jgi:hypothetical protein
MIKRDAGLEASRTRDPSGPQPNAFIDRRIHFAFREITDREDAIPPTLWHGFESPYPCRRISICHLPFLICHK